MPEVPRIPNLGYLVLLMKLRTLNLGTDRCPVVMQKVMLATKQFVTSEDDNFLISTIEQTAVRDITALLSLKYPNLCLADVAIEPSDSGNIHHILLSASR